VPDDDLASLKWMPWRFKMVHRLRAHLYPEAVCAPSTSHDPRWFAQTAASLGMACEILPIHRLHPYHGFRFNVLLNKVSAKAEAA
jgi:hypothetical protein